MEVGDSDDEDEEPVVQPPVAKEKIQAAADMAAVPTLETSEERAAREREAKVSKRSILDYQTCQLCGRLFHMCRITCHKQYLSVLLLCVYLSPSTQPAASRHSLALCILAFCHVSPSSNEGLAYHFALVFYVLFCVVQ